ncbi:MAG TPA: hypothetical protein ENF86_02960 [Firmicutes bacterium]|nr:hypothetical protein [Bacillota bacterium]
MSFLTRIQGIKRAFLSNLGTKIFALSLAILLWLHVVTGRSYEAVFEVALKVGNIPEGMVVANQLPEKVAVKFFGQGRQLLRLPYSKTALVLKITSPRAGPRKYRLSPLDVKVPIGLKVEPRKIVKPKTITVELNRLITKKAKVIPHVRLQLADGYVQVGPIKVVPERVKISGPQKFLRRVQYVSLDSLFFSKVKRDISEPVRVIPPEGTNIVCSPPVVNLSIDIQALGERWIKDIPVRLRYSPRGRKIRIEPSTIDLKLQGGVELLATLSSEDISAYIDYRRVRRMKKAEVPAIISPKVSGIELIEARPERFNVVTE